MSGICQGDGEEKGRCQGDVREMPGRCRGDVGEMMEMSGRWGDTREAWCLEVDGLSDLDRVEAKEALQKVVVHLGDEGVPELVTVNN